MNRKLVFYAGLHRFVVVTAATTFFLIIAGGLVTSTDSGLAVPDWPLSYGQLMPPMVGGIFYEHGHRMVATFVGFLTTVMAFWLWRKDERKGVRRLGWIALLAVITQGILGGITVLLLLPTWVSVSHATLAQTFFSLTIVLALMTSRLWKADDTETVAAAGRTRLWVILAAGAIWIQLILGALMRHSASGLAIPDFPMSYGHWLPPMNGADMASLNDYRLTYYDLPPIDITQIWIHFAHRVGAVVVTAIVLGCVIHILRNYKLPRLRETAIILGLLLLVQFLLGALTVWTGKGVQIATAHVAVGALLLGTSVALAAYTFRLVRVPETEPELAPLAAEPTPA